MSGTANLKFDSWKSHIESQRRSGLSRAVYCREHNLKLHQFNYFLGKHERLNNSKPSGFARVLVKEPMEPAAPPAGLRLLVGRDLCLAINPPTDPVWIAALIRELRMLP